MFNHFLHYDQCSISIIMSILKKYGIDLPDNGIKASPFVDHEIKADEYNNIIFMLFDGLGNNIFEKFLDEKSFLKVHKAYSTTTVFPPTTVAALTSYKSALTPIQSGWLGWNLFFKEYNSNVEIFKNKIVTDNYCPDYDISELKIGYKNIFQLISPFVTTNYLSKFSDYPNKINSLEDINLRIQYLLETSKCNFIFTYYTEPDTMQHLFGTTHNNTIQQLKEIDNSIEKLFFSIQNKEKTLIIITADHGLIDTNYLYYEDYPEIAKRFLREPSIEARTQSLYVKHNYKKTFKNDFKKCFGAYYNIFTKKEVLNNHLFGFGNPHSLTNDFIGDFIAIAKSNVTILQNRNEPEYKAVHAGMTKDELEVPVVIIHN